MADRIDGPKAIEEWFARCQPKIASSASQGRSDSPAEIAEAFIAGNSQIRAKERRN